MYANSVCILYMCLNLYIYIYDKYKHMHIYTHIIIDVNIALAIQCTKRVVARLELSTHTKMWPRKSNKSK